MGSWNRAVDQAVVVFHECVPQRSSVGPTGDSRRGSSLRLIRSSGRHYAQPRTFHPEVGTTVHWLQGSSGGTFLLHLLLVRRTQVQESRLSVIHLPSQVNTRPIRSSSRR